MSERNRRVAWWWAMPLGLAACMSAESDGTSSGGCGGGTRGLLAAGWFRTSDCPGAGGLTATDDCLGTTPFATDARARLEFQADQPDARVAGVRSTAPAAVRVDRVVAADGGVTFEIATVGPGAASLVIDGDDGPLDQVDVTVAPATGLTIETPTRMIVGGQREVYGTVTGATGPLAGRGGYVLRGEGVTITPGALDRSGFFGPGPDFVVEATAVGSFDLAVPGLMAPRPVEVIPTSAVTAVTLSSTTGVVDQAHGGYVWLVYAGASDGTGGPALAGVPCDWRASRPAWLEPDPWGVWVRSPLPRALEVTCLLDGRVMATVTLPPAT